MPNSLIELHDSTIKEISHFKDAVIVYFSRAYIHQSDGKAGIDKGNVWIQEAEILLESAQKNGNFSEYPATLYDGELNVNDKIYDNSIPLPLNEKGRINLKIISDNQIIISSQSITVTLIGKPKYIEQFPGNS